MSHYVAGLSKRHSNRMLAASRAQQETGGPRAPKTPRTDNDVSSQSVSVLVNSSVPGHVHVDVSIDVRDEFIIPVDEDYLTNTEQIPHSIVEADSDESGDECEERDPHLHIVIDSELEGVDITDCTEEVNEVEFIHRPAEPEAVTQLRLWAITNRISRSAVDALLKTLRAAHGPLYPKSAKTLLRTPREPTIAAPMTPGHYYHFGIKQGILSYPGEELQKLDNVMIDIGTDGFQFASSSKIVGWPIFGSIVGFEQSAFIIGLYIGKAKPDSIDDFMLPFMQEYQAILDEGGISIDQTNGFHLIKIKIRLFVTDTPARCFVVSTHYHTHTFGCHRCHAQMVRRNFPALIGDIRTDSTFTERKHTEHHSDEHKVKYSILERFGFNMISQFPLDVMHLVDLGIGKLILSSIVNATKKQITDMFLLPRPANTSAANHRKLVRSAMSARHGEFKSNSPQVFGRYPRPLDECKYFKATEFRQFILYTGVVLMKEYSSNEAFHHFLCLSLGYRVLFSSNLNTKKLDAAQKLMSLFVKDFRQYYKRNLSYNVHSLLHLVDDARIYGRVDTFSAYKYENSIRKIQLLVKNNSNIFSQIKNRLDERRSAGVQEDCSPKFVNLSLPRNRYHRLDINHGVEPAIFKYLSIVRVLDCKRKCIVRYFDKTSEYFNIPMSSLVYGIVLVDDCDLGEEEEVDIQELEQMCYGIPTKDSKIVLLPLVHY